MVITFNTEDKWDSCWIDQSSKPVELTDLGGCTSSLKQKVIILEMGRSCLFTNRKDNRVISAIGLISPYLPEQLLTLIWTNYYLILFYNSDLPGLFPIFIKHLFTALAST